MTVPEWERMAKGKTWMDIESFINIIFAERKFYLLWIIVCAKNKSEKLWNVLKS